MSLDPSLHIEARHCNDQWSGWPSAQRLPSGVLVRPISAGKQHKVKFPRSQNEDSLLCIELADKASIVLARELRVSIGDRILNIHRSHNSPEFLIARLPKDFPAEHSFVVTIALPETSLSSPVMICSITVLSLHVARFSARWTSLRRTLLSLIIGEDKMQWSLADFPYSHFDGISYLLRHSKARAAVLSRRYRTAFHYFQAKGKQFGHRLPLAFRNKPLPGTPFNLVSHYREVSELLSTTLAHNKQRLTVVSEENELLLTQLHKMQEELEKCIVDNERQVKALKDTINDLAATRNSIMIERETFSKLASERATRISELEELVARQSDHQKLVDEEIARAQGQLDMLKQMLESEIR
jgi:hypothetical protein